MDLNGFFALQKYNILLFLFILRFCSSLFGQFLVGLSLGDQSTLTRAVEILQNEVC